MKWQDDKRWSDAFLPEIKQILGLWLIGEAPVEEDAERNTDLIVLRMEAVRIACRVRNHKYVARFSDEFTLRAGRPSGVKTELTKIVEGWGNYFLYGFATADESGLAAWTLADLSVFRLWFNRQIVENWGDVPGTRRDNADGSSFFFAYDIASLPENFVVARKTIAEKIPAVHPELAFPLS